MSTFDDDATDRQRDDQRKLAARELAELSTRPSAFLDDLAAVAQRFNVSLTLSVHPLDVDLDIVDDEPGPTDNDE